MSRSSATESRSKATRTGTRPTNSRMRPMATKSWAVLGRSTSWAAAAAAVPPPGSKAPEKTKRTCFVEKVLFVCVASVAEANLDGDDDLEAAVPVSGTSKSSMSLSSEVWTSRVLTEPKPPPSTLFGLWQILSISSTYTIPKRAASTSSPAASSNCATTSATSRPTKPVAENLVASALTKGAWTRSAAARTRCDLPEPEGPKTSMLGLWKCRASSAGSSRHRRAWW
mmetsp:Transcript_21621/g.85933  ORF Transcript_21621/g.85933 Transcript_21621/m.85933 type:complete len:226 (+) Transcript_21621:584-1261(+)